MKTDLVLTMDEYLAMSCGIAKHVNPPTRAAQHIPITAEGDFGASNEARARYCNRWSHPCPGCTDQNHGKRVPVQDLKNKEQR